MNLRNRRGRLTRHELRTGEKPKCLLQNAGRSFSRSATFARDLDLKGAFSASSSLTPGNGNVLHAVIRNVTGSGLRYNFYADAGSTSTPLPAATEGTGNRLEIVGNPASFARTNRDIDPAPDAVFFTGKSN